MSWWDERAGKLQTSVRAAEIERPDVDYFDEHDIKRAIIHSREDLVLIYSQLSSLNAQISCTKWLLVLIAALLSYATLK